MDPALGVMHWVCLFHITVRENPRILITCPGTPESWKWLTTQQWRLDWTKNEQRLRFCSSIFSDTLRIISKKHGESFWWSGWWNKESTDIFSRKWRCKSEKLLEFLETSSLERVFSENSICQASWVHGMSGWRIWFTCTYPCWYERGIVRFDIWNLLIC